MKTLTKIYACIAAASSLVAAALCAGCTPEQRYSESVGEFYTLDEAYENGWLMQGDLKNIAYYYHTRYGETEHIDQSFVPTPKTPETLNEETQNKIKRTYLDEVAMVPDGTFDNIDISQYYGTYNGCVVIGIVSDYLLIDPLLYPEYVIGEVSFFDYVPSAIGVWREGENVLYCGFL